MGKYSFLRHMLTIQPSPAPEQESCCLSCCLGGVLPPPNPNNHGCKAADIGKDWGKEASKHSIFHIYLRTSIKSTTKDFLLLFWIKARLAKVCGILRDFFPSKSKDDTDQPNCEPDHNPRISHLTAANVTKKDPACWPAPRGAGPKAAGCDS